MTGWDPASTELLSLMPRTARGPRRDGVFALWLIVRAALDLLLEPPLSERVHRKRITALEARLSSLSLPAPLRRALTAALLHLRDARPETAAPVLAHLVAPARETVGAEVSEALALAARAARPGGR